MEAATTPPASEVSGPVIAFCTELERSSRSVRSNGRHLPHLALAAQANPDQHDQVDHPRAQHDLQQHVPGAREQDSVQLAVTGTGAFFGVLR